MRMVAMLNRLIRRPPVRTKSAFERTALLARNRSHNRTHIVLDFSSACWFYTLRFFVSGYLTRTGPSSSP